MNNTPLFIIVQEILTTYKYSGILCHETEGLMKLFFQRILARIDKLVSTTFRITSMGTGPEGNQKWTFYTDNRRKIGIVGVDGNIHAVMGCHAVHHYYVAGKLMRRVPVRKDLAPGERLATADEIIAWREASSKRFQERGGFSVIIE